MTSSQAVTAYSLPQLKELLTQAARSRGSKDFICAPDVEQAVLGAVPARNSPDYDFTPPDFMPSAAGLYDLMAVPIIPDGSLAAGEFVLTTHTSCDVDPDRDPPVTHDRCPRMVGVLQTPTMEGTPRP